MMSPGQRKLLSFHGAIIGVFFLSLWTQGNQELPKGQIVGKVLCAKDRSFSYALYLPAAYTADKEWPVIVCFDPRAQGRRPVELLQVAAESFGYIVAGSLDSKNGPLEPSQQAARAVWADLRERFSIHPQRVYSAGFSGGAEVAVLFPYLVETRVAGIISCGAGLPPKHEPQWIKPAAYCGIIGNLDFRYLDMVRLPEPFKEARITHRILSFDGWHQWPPAERLAEAVEWLELCAMKDGLLDKDAAFIEQEFQKRLKNARDLEKSGRLVPHVREMESLSSDFKGLLDVEGLDPEISEIKSRPEFKQQENEEKEARERESVLQPRAIQVFANLDQLVSAQTAVRLKDIERALNVDKLLSDSGQTKDVFRSESSKRILSQIAILADQRGFRAREAGNYPLAVLCFELAVRSSAGHPMHPAEYYNLAAAYARWGKLGDALKNLDLALGKGFDDLEFLENDRDFEVLRGHEEYKGLLDRLRAKKRTEPS